MKSGKKATFGEAERLLNASDSRVRETHLMLYDKKKIRDI